MKRTPLFHLSLLFLSAVALGCGKQGGSGGSSASSSAGGSTTGPTAPTGCYETNPWPGVYGCTTPNPMFEVCCEGLGSNYYCWDLPAPDGAGSACGSNDPFDPNGGGTTGGDKCEKCPEPYDDASTCEGHAEWTRGITLWGLYEHPASHVRTVDPISTDNTDGPVCSSSFGVCVSYTEPDDISDLQSGMLADQLEACNSMTLQQAKNQGLPGMAGGFELIHFWCRAGDSISATYEGVLYEDTETSVSECASGWSYEGFCSEEDCPLEEGGTGTGTGGADSTTSAGLEEEYDCSAFSKDNVSWTQTYTSRYLLERTASIRGDLLDKFTDDPYGSLYWCLDAVMDPDTLEIWDVKRKSFLRNLGIVEDDIIVEVGGHTNGEDMVNQIADDILSNHDTTIQIKRGWMTVFYTVKWG